MNWWNAWYGDTRCSSDLVAEVFHYNFQTPSSPTGLTQAACAWAKQNGHYGNRCTVIGPPKPMVGYRSNQTYLIVGGGNMAPLPDQSTHERGHDKGCPHVSTLPPTNPFDPDKALTIWRSYCQSGSNDACEYGGASKMGAVLNDTLTAYERQLIGAPSTIISLCAGQGATLDDGWGARMVRDQRWTYYVDYAAASNTYRLLVVGPYVGSYPMGGAHPYNLGMFRQVGNCQQPSSSWCKLATEFDDPLTNTVIRFYPGGRVLYDRKTP
jgi:hypothetical protein